MRILDPRAWNQIVRHECASEYTKYINGKHMLVILSNRCILQNKSEDGKGGLPTDIPEYTFICECNNCIKAKPFFASAALSNWLSVCKNMDELRMKII